MQEPPPWDQDLHATARARGAGAGGGRGVSRERRRDASPPRAPAAFPTTLPGEEAPTTLRDSTGFVQDPPCSRGWVGKPSHPLCGSKQRTRAAGSRGCSVHGGRRVLLCARRQQQPAWSLRAAWENARWRSQTSQPSSTPSPLPEGRPRHSAAAQRRAPADAGRGRQGMGRQGTSPVPSGSGISRGAGQAGPPRAALASPTTLSPSAPFAGAAAAPRGAMLSHRVSRAEGREGKALPFAFGKGARRQPGTLAGGGTGQNGNKKTKTLMV